MKEILLIFAVFSFGYTHSLTPPPPPHLLSVFTGRRYLWHWEKRGYQRGNEGAEGKKGRSQIRRRQKTSSTSDLIYLNPLISAALWIRIHMNRFHLAVLDPNPDPYLGIRIRIQEHENWPKFTGIYLKNCFRFKIFIFGLVSVVNLKLNLFNISQSILKEIDVNILKVDKKWRLKS